jgi:DNA-binding GntR family transcriptional regulator
VPPGHPAPIDPLPNDEAVVELRSQLVARRLREAIVGGRYSPGERLRQEEIAGEMGISRVPVREALRQLETEGLVTLAPHAGATVAQLDANDLDEIYAIRIAVEPMLIAESAPRLDQAQLEHLRDLVLAIEAAADAPERWLELDRRFHVESFAGAPMPQARELVEGFWNRTQHYRRAHVFGMTRDDLDVVQLEHRLILDALRRGNGEDAGAALRTHLRRTREALHQRSGLFGAGEAGEPGDAGD